MDSLRRCHYAETFGLYNLFESYEARDLQGLLLNGMSHFRRARNTELPGTVCIASLW